MCRHGRETHHYLKKGRMLISLDLCILNQAHGLGMGGSGEDGWYQDKHRQETVALLEESVTERISEYYMKRAARYRRREKDAKPKLEEPKMLKGNTVKIGFKFTKRPVTQRCLLTNSNFQTITLFPEKLHVYVCEYHPSTVLHATAQLMHTMHKDITPDTAAGISNYFQSGSNLETKKVGTMSAVKKRNKLKRLVGRRKTKKPAEACSMESGYDTITSNPVPKRDDAKSLLEPNDKNAMHISHQAACGSASEEALRGKTNDVHQTETTKEPRRCFGKATTSKSPFKKQSEKLRNSDVLEPLKDRLNVGHRHATRALGAVKPTETASNVGGCREPIEWKRPEPVKILTVNEPRDQSGRFSFKKKESAGALTYEPGMQSNEIRSHAATNDDEGDVEMIDLEGIVDLCEDDEAALPGGEISCLKDGKPDVECMSKLDASQLRHLVRRNKRFLKEIFIGKRPCQRHLDYKQGGYARVNLTYEAWYGPFTEEQVDCIMKELMKVYCAKSNKFFEYVSKVLLPEALTKICMDVLHVLEDKAKGILEDIPLCGDATLLGNIR